MQPSDPAQSHADQAQDAMHAAAENHGSAIAIAHGIAAAVHALLSIREELRTANQIAVWDDGMAGKYIGPPVDAANDDARDEQQAIRTAFKRDHRDRLRQRTGLV